jgi:hypothetical protein
MQQQIFDDLCKLLPELAELQAKITYLIDLKKKLQDQNHKVSIYISLDYPVENPMLCITENITQDFIPFNLRMELQQLLNDSIDEYQRVYLNLYQYMNDFNKTQNLKK